MINCSTYYFWKSEKGYYQYPMDYSEELFNSYSTSFKSASQIVVHRISDLMYYTYMRQVSERESFYIGISIVINGLETHNISSLFRLFEKVFEKIVVEEKILYFNNEGIIEFRETDINSNINYLDGLTLLIKEYVNQGCSSFIDILPYNYSIGINDYAKISIDEGDHSVTECIQSNNKIIITKDSRLLSSELNGLKIRLVHLYEQIEFLKSYNNRQTHISRDYKNHIAWMTISIILIIVITVFIFTVITGLITISY